MSGAITNYNFMDDYGRHPQGMQLSADDNRTECNSAHSRGFGDDPGGAGRTPRVEILELQEHRNDTTSNEDSRNQQKGGGAAVGSTQEEMIKLPRLVREFGAECLGTFLLVFFGDGAIAQVVIGGTSFGNFLNIALGFGLALMVGILVSGGVSGGHLNPAVTLTMALFKRTSWIQLPVYWLAQYIGAFLASAVLYGVYYDAIVSVGKKVPGTAGIFASYPNSGYDVSATTLAFDQILGTAMLLIIIFAVTDENNLNISSNLAPLFIGLGLTAIHLSFGLNAGCAINPARDLSPRLLTLMAGWGGDTFTYAHSFSWIPFILPHLGGILGGGLYWLLVGAHHKPDDEEN